MTHQTAKLFLIISLLAMVFQAGCAQEAKESKPDSATPNVVKPALKQETKPAPEPSKAKAAEEAPSPDVEKSVKKNALEDESKTEKNKAADAPADDNVKGDETKPTKTKAKVLKDSPRTGRAMDSKASPARRRSKGVMKKSKKMCPPDDTNCNEDDSVLRKKPAR